MEKLLDPSISIYIDKFVGHRCIKFRMARNEAPNEGVVTGYGIINKRPVCILQARKL